MAFRSSVEAVGKMDLPDYIYYNADIINNETADLTADSLTALTDPQIRFNETRDAPLIKDASQYYFSIVRFTMNGAGRDLPLFIPLIDEGTGQTNVNLTTYGMAVPFSQSWYLSAAAPAPTTLTVAPATRFIQYQPESQNPVLSPLPKSVAAPTYKGLYSPATVYQQGDIVATATNPLYSIGLSIPVAAPNSLYQVSPPPQWVGTRAYNIGDYVSYTIPANTTYQSYGGALIPAQTLTYRCIAPVAAPVFPANNPSPNNAPANWTTAIYSISGIAPGTAPWAFLPDTPNQGGSQDLTTRYYWVYTYQHWVDLWNQTMLDKSQLGAAAFPVGARPISTCCLQDTYYAFADAWVAAGGAAVDFPYATLQAFVNVVNAPQMVYSPDTKRFKIIADSQGWGERVIAFTPAAGPGAVAATNKPKFRLFFNTNMYGLFANFSNAYYNTPTIPAQTIYSGNLADTFPAFPQPAAGGYVNEILFPNKFYQNALDYRLSPYAGTPPLGYVPPNGYTTALTEQRVYWVAEQDFFSTSDLWSPIASIVFLSTLLPVRAEQTGPPVILGSGNLGFSEATAQSAFQPIITDLALDLSDRGAEAYKHSFYYVPSAEYRLSDFTGSRQDIRNIDIQVYWKCRLDSQLYPLSMFNTSSVSVKLMFRHKDAHAGEKG